MRVERCMGQPNAWLDFRQKLQALFRTTIIMNQWGSPFRLYVLVKYRIQNNRAGPHAYKAQSGDIQFPTEEERISPTASIMLALLSCACMARSTRLFVGRRITVGCCYPRVRSGPQQPSIVRPRVEGHQISLHWRQPFRGYVAGRAGVIREGARWTLPR